MEETESIKLTGVYLGLSFKKKMKKSKEPRKFQAGLHISQ